MSKISVAIHSDENFFIMMEDINDYTAKELAEHIIKEFEQTETEFVRDAIVLVEGEEYSNELRVYSSAIQALLLSHWSLSL